MKTSELQGAALDWAVAKCVELVGCDDFDVGFILEGGYTPSTNWAQGGPIIEREKINLGWVFCDGREFWTATMYLAESEGSTPLIAAMRCYVASKLGDEIEIPEELK